MSFMRGRFCPDCGSSEIYPSLRRTLADKFLRLFGIRPYRCRHCNSSHTGFSGMKHARRYNVSD